MRSFRDENNKSFLTYCTENNLLQQDLLLDAKNGNLTYNDGFSLIRLNIKGAGGSVKLVSASTLQKDGQSDFNNGRLRDNLSMILKALIVAHASEATETNPAKVQYKYTHSTLPSALQNAEIELSQGNKSIKRLPVTAVMCATESQNPVGMDSDFELENWDIIRGDSPMEITLRFPEGVSMPTDKEYFIEVILRGSYLERKNK